MLIRQVWLGEAVPELHTPYFHCFWGCSQAFQVFKQNWSPKYSLRMLEPENWEFGLRNLKPTITQVSSATENCPDNAVTLHLDVSVQQLLHWLDGQFCAWHILAAFYKRKNLPIFKERSFSQWQSNQLKEEWLELPKGASKVDVGSMYEALFIMLVSVVKD